MIQLERGEPVSVATRTGMYAGTFLREDRPGYVEVWVGSRARVVRRDHVAPTTRRAVPVKTYENLYGDDD